MVCAQAAEGGGHPVDGHTQQLHGHLGVGRLHVLTQVTVVAHSVQQDVCHLQGNKQQNKPLIINYVYNSETETILKPLHLSNNMHILYMYNRHEHIHVFQTG